MAAIFGEGKIFLKNCQEYNGSDTLCVENFDEIALSRTVKEMEANLCFAIFGKNSKIQNGRHFWGGENVLKIAKCTFFGYPVGRKFAKNTMAQIPCVSKISTKSLYLARLRR